MIPARVREKVSTGRLSPGSSTKVKCKLGEIEGSRYQKVCPKAEDKRVLNIESNGVGKDKSGSAHPAK